MTIEKFIKMLIDNGYIIPLYRQEPTVSNLRWINRNCNITNEYERSILCELLIKNM